MRMVGIAALLAAFFCSFLPPFIVAVMAVDARSMPKKSSRITLLAVILGVQALATVLLHGLVLGHWDLIDTLMEFITGKLSGQQQFSLLSLSLFAGLVLALWIGFCLRCFLRVLPMTQKRRALLLAAAACLCFVAVLPGCLSLGSVESLVINEVGSSYGTRSDRTNGDYIELYNPSPFACRLLGAYISDDSAELAKEAVPNCTVPAGGYYIIDLSESIVSLRDEGGEEVFLTDRNGKILDSVVTGVVRGGYAYSRRTDGGNDWAELRATPGATNRGAADPAALIPAFSHQSGFYKESFQLTITAPEGCTIHYTLDGAVPTEKSPVYQKPITVYDKSKEPNIFRSMERVVPKWKTYKPNRTPVDKAFIIRAVAISEDGAVGEPITATYFVNLDAYKDLTVFSVVVDPDEMWGLNGIGVTGMEYDIWYEGGQKGTAPTTNFRKHGREYEIAGAISYFSGDQFFEQQVGVRINGGSNRDGALKRLALHARTQYSGTEYFAKTLIGDLPSQAVVFRDEISNVINQRLMLDRYVAVQRTTPVTMFLNGEFWYNTELIEKYDSNYFYQHYGIDPDNLIVCKKDELQEGLPTDMTYQQQIHSFVNANDMSKKENYDRFCQLVDVQSYIDFIIANLYCDNMDFDDYKNVVVWKARNATDTGYGDGRWRFALYDMDAIAWNDHEHFGLATQAEKNPFELKFRFVSSLKDQVVWSRLIKNEQFRQQFVLTFMDLVNTVYDYDYVAGEFLSYTEKEPPKFYADFFSARPSYMTSYLAKAFGLTGTLETLKLQVNDPAGGTLRANTADISMPSGQWSGNYYTDYPVTVTAIPSEGYEFAGWEGVTDADGATATVHMQEGGVSIHAIFQKIS